MKLEGDYQLEAFAPAQRKIYVGYGDSVSHGTGQKSASYLTWPYQLAEKIDYEVYSLAVGGASIKLPIIDVVSERQRKGDKNLFLIDGQSITTLDDAMNPGNVHLGVEGAAHWAEKLYPQIREEL